MPGWLAPFALNLLGGYAGSKLASLGAKYGTTALTRYVPPAAGKLSKFIGPAAGVAGGYGLGSFLGEGMAPSRRRRRGRGISAADLRACGRVKRFMKKMGCTCGAARRTYGGRRKRC